MNRLSGLDPNYVPSGPLPRREPGEDFAREPQPHVNRHLPSQLPSHLPPTLTSEQLAHLDVLTRESIDERLRILEGVSGAVYRCIDDLMRLRSALPPLDGPVAGSASSASHTGAESSATKEPAASTNGNSTTNGESATNGKEKQRATVEELPESEPANAFQ